MKTKATEFARLIALAGWSQAETARRLDLSPGAVSQICNGKTEPRRATLSLLKLLLRSTPTTWKRVAGPSPSRLAEWELELLRPLRELSPGQREALLSAFRAILKTVSGRPARSRRGD